MSRRDHIVVHDGVHGSIRLDGQYGEILDTPEMQRMGQIHQLGLANLVFPGANHTRMEHMIGAFHLSGRFCISLGIKGQEAEMLRLAALVHDVGHPPFSHTFEDVLRSRLGIDHMELTARIIKGEVNVVPDGEDIVLEGQPRIVDCIEKSGLDVREVADLVMMEKGVAGVAPYLTSLIHGPVDVDQLDYLMRDAHYTGVAPGRIDADRIVETSILTGGTMAVGRRGMSAVEGLTVSRVLMNSSVYFHKTVRIAEMMLTKAVSMLEPGQFVDVFKDTDASLSERLKMHGGFQREIALRLKYRKLYKTSFLLSIDSMDSEQKKRISTLSRKGMLPKIEDELSLSARAEPGSVIIDSAPIEYLAGSGRKGKTEVPILDDDGKIRKLTSLSPIARAVQLHSRQDWGLMVVCDGRIRSRITKIAAHAIFG